MNHLASRTSDPDRLRAFYLELTDADELEGEHGPLRVGQTLLVFFAWREHGATDDPDEIAIHDDPAVYWRE